MATAPFVITSNALGGEGSPSASNRLTVGCIGVGGQGVQDMMGFCGCADVQVVAVCDVDKPRRDSAKNRVDEFYDNIDCACYGDFRDIIARQDIDIVCIATPDHWHIIPAIWAMQAGKDVFVEKPLTLTLDEGKLVVEAANRYGAVTQVNTWQRSIHNFQHAKNLIRSGQLGKIKSVKVGLPGGGAQGPQDEQLIPEGFDYDFWLGQAPWAPYNASRCHGAFRWCYDYSGGGLTDWGAHHLDIVQWCMGTDHTGPVEVDAKGEFPNEGIWDTAVSYNFTCKYDEGFTLYGASSGEKPGVLFEGEDGRWLHVDRGILATNPPDLKKKDLEADEMLQLWVSGDHVRDFLDCVKSRRETVTPVAIGHRSISIAHLVNLSMRLDRKLHWDPREETIIGDREGLRMMSRAMRSPWHL